MRASSKVPLNLSETIQNISIIEMLVSFAFQDVNMVRMFVKSGFVSLSTGVGHLINISHNTTHGFA